MKAVLISGSPRPKGNTVDVLAACAKALEEEGVETVSLSLAGKKIEGCIACNRCKQEQGHCALAGDDFEEILEQVKTAKGFIIGAPVYFGTARGDVMNLLQRLGMVSKGGDHFLERMVGGPVAVGRRGGHTSTIQELLMFFFINGMTVPGSNYWNILFGKGQGEALKDDEGMSNVVYFAKNVARLLKLEAGA